MSAQDAGCSVPEITSEKYVELFDHLAMAVLVHDTDGAIRWVNQQFVVVFGYSYAQARTLTVRALIAPESSAAVERDWQALRGGQARAVSGAQTMVRKNGIRLRVMIHSTSVRRGGDTLVVAFIGDWTDEHWADSNFLPVTG